MKNNICCVLLDYCGGERTDALCQQFSKWNPDHKINVLDNASHQNKSRYITHQNTKNSGVGGGIVDSIRIAKDQGAAYLFMITNDIIPLDTINIGYFEEMLDSFPDVVQLSASITKDSDQGHCYPWMVNAGTSKDRIVRHADILCCALNLEFIERFGGFPVSISGWGYDWEIAYNAKTQNKKIVISDLFTIMHVNDPEKKEKRKLKRKMNELKKIYNAKYGSYKKLANVVYI